MKATVEVSRFPVEVFQLAAQLAKLVHKAGVVAEKVTDGIEIGPPWSVQTRLSDQMLGQLKNYVQRKTGGRQRIMAPMLTDPRTAEIVRRPLNIRA